MTTVSEDDFLARWLPRLETGRDLVIPPGDDCAATQLANDILQLIAVDQVVAGHHYLPDEDPIRVGRKLLARNLSDIAAMGGTPTHALVTLALPPDTASARADGIMQGIHALAQETKTLIIGGDICAAPAESATLTILGTVATNDVIQRNGAKPGDLIFVTGTCGGSFPSEHHLDFTPRLPEGQHLARHHYPSAMIDLSDGLALDLQRICKASDVSATLDLNAIPRREHSGSPASIEAACFDGEDYELLFAVPATKAQDLINTWPFPTPLTQIGTCQPAGPNSITTTSGQALDLANKTFNHF